MHIFKSKVFLKIFASTYAILAISALIIGSISYYKAYDVVYNRICKENMQAASNLRDYTDNFYRNLYNVVVRLDSNPSLRRVFLLGSDVDFERFDFLEQQSAIKYIRNIKSEMNVIENVAVILNKSGFILDSEGMYTTEFYFTSKYIFNTMDTKGVNQVDWNSNSPVVKYCSIKKYESTYKPYSLFIRTLPLSSYIKHDSAVIIYLDMEKMMEKLAVYEPYPQSLLLITDENGKMFFSNKDLDKIQLDQLENIIDNTSGKIKYEGLDYEYYSARSTYNGYKNIILIPTKVVMSDVHDIGKITLVIIIATLLLGLIFAYATALTNYKPIQTIFGKYAISRDMKSKSINDLKCIEQEFEKLTFENSSLKNDIELYKPVIRNNMLFKLLKKRNFNADLIGELAELSIEFPYSYYAVALLQLEVLERVVSDAPVNNTKLSILMLRYLEEYFQYAGYRAYAIETESFTYNLIINTNDTDNFKLLEKMKELILKIKQSFNLNVNHEVEIIVGVSEVTESINNLYPAAQQAVQALKHILDNGKVEVVTYDMIKHEIKHETKHEVKNNSDLTVDYEKRSLQKGVDNVGDDITNDIVSFINDNFICNNMSLTMLSEQFNLNGIYISRLIKEKLGTNFIDYVNKLRIDKAKLLLSNLKESIKSVAEEVGYESDLNFRRVFKKYTGMTPGQFRQDN